MTPKCRCELQSLYLIIYYYYAFRLHKIEVRCERARRTAAAINLLRSKNCERENQEDSKLSHNSIIYLFLFFLRCFVLASSLLASAATANCPHRKKKKKMVSCVCCNRCVIFAAAAAAAVRTANDGGKNEKLIQHRWPIATGDECRNKTR